MTDVRVRDVSEDIVYMLKDQAKRKGQTLQASLVDLLTEAAMRPRKEMLATLKQHQDRMREKYGVMDDSTPYIRAERERIG